MQQVNAEPYISITQKYIEVNSDQLSHAVELLWKAKILWPECSKRWFWA